ncbi:putative tail-fiber protein [Acinetobacter phage vB_AbM_WUPSU]|nr:putative tail-fiber protein [Acinetobacter phage vB_AbM_WUPSU]
MTNPTLITTPFAENGDKNTIPESVGAEPQNATMQAGFPPITQQKISEGGIPPERNDFNGMFNLVTQHLVHLNNGMSYEFDQEHANKIGGYPLNARLMLSNGDIVRSTVANNVNNPNSDMTGWVIEDGNKYVQNPSNLLDITNPKNKQRAFVYSIQKWYTYMPSSTEANNGVTVVDKWVMDVQDAYYASWFATPNDLSDQSVKLQTGYDYATSKGRKFVIDEVFYVEANQSYSSIENNSIIIRDNSLLEFSANGKLLQINQNKNQSNILLCMRIKNFKIISPVLVGDRLENSYLPPTSNDQGFGYGIAVYEAENGYIFEPKVSQCHGDNIYIGKPWGSNQAQQPKNITIVRPHCDHARRNCISLTAWDNVKIIDPVLSYAGDSDGITGAFPKSCIDIELENAPDFPPANGYNGIITNPKCMNSDNGIFFYCSYDNRDFNIHVQGDVSLSNISTIGVGLFHGSNSCNGLVKIDNVRYLTNMFQEIALAWHKNSNLKAEIDNIYPLSNDTGFELATVLNGDFSTKTFGNVTLNNIHTTGFCAFTCDVGSDYKVDGYRFFASNNAKNGITYFTNNPDSQALISGKDTYIESRELFIHAGFSKSSEKMPNEIWQDPSISPTDFIYINTTNDFRVLKIGLFYNTANIGNGCNINNLNLLIDGSPKTQARTTTLGGWLKFQNVSGGRTKIIDSYGTWTFS